MKPIAITSLFCLLLFTGCSGDESIPVERQDNWVPLSITSASVENVDASLTRAAVTPTPLTEGSIGIFLEGATGTSYEKKDDIQYKYSSSAWVPNVTSETLYLGGENANVCAYYKTTKIASVADKKAVVLTSQIFDTELDLLYATNQTVNGTSSGKKVEFILGHAYSQIEFVLKRENYPNTCKVTNIAVKNANIIGSTTLNLATGVYATGTKKADFSYDTNPTTSAKGIEVPKTSTATSKLLMVPCTLANNNGTGLTLVLTVDGKAMTATVPYANLSALVAGKNHQITVVLKGTAIDVSVKDTPWESVPVNGEYNPEPVAPQP